MSDYLTILPIELIHQIFDNVPTVDILLSLNLVNKRLRSASLAYPRLQPDFSCITTAINKKQFDSICTQLRHSISQIVSLTLFNKDDPITPMKNDLFFLRFSCSNSTFSNLRSLTLTYINHDTWCSFKTRLPSLLIMLSICLVHVGQRASLSMTSAIFTDILFISLSLEHLSIQMNNYSNDMIIIHPRNSTILSSLQYFHSEYIKIDLCSLFTIAPMLHTLEIKYQNEDWPLDSIYVKSIYLQRLRIELYSIHWSEMVNLILSFPQLTYLTVILDDCSNEMADGFSWTPLLQNIKHFECKLHFSPPYSYHRQSINLDSFRTKFWLEEKKWFVNYNRNLNNANVTLYTVSSSINDYLSQTIIALLISESTEYVHCLTINYEYLKYAFLYHDIYTTELALLKQITTLPMIFKDLNTSRITTCNGSSYEWKRKSPHELVKFLHNIPCLHALGVSVSVLEYLYSYQWPNITHLRIENDFENGFQLSSSYEIDELCRSFTHIERLDIHATSITVLSQLLNRMKKTLIDVIIRQSLFIKKEQFITREWIEQNTEFQHFHYTCDAMNSVRLWF